MQPRRRRRSLQHIAGITLLLAVAELDPAIPYVTPGYLADVARRLMTNGNSVSAIQVHRGQVTLLPTSGFDIRGGPDPDSWFYHVDLPGPTRRESRVLPNASVIHGRINVGPTQPWLGISALVHAGVSAKAIANLETRLSQEASSRVGYNLPYSADLSASQVNELKTSLDTMPVTSDSCGLRRIVTTPVARSAVVRTGRPGAMEWTTPMATSRCVKTSQWTW